MNIDEKGKWRTSGEEKKHKTEKGTTRRLYTEQGNEMVDLKLSKTISHTVGTNSRTRQHIKN
jgi:hypothetical protein